MREVLRKLKDGEYWIYGPSAHEFENVIEFIQRLSDYADECIDRMTSNEDVDPELTEAHEEVSSDLRYYNHIEKGLLWSFALWRLQGMLEATIVDHYLLNRPTKPLVGLRSKISALLADGYTISKKHDADLHAWANLRNLLSHMPPEHYRTVAIDRYDIDEYVALLKAVCAIWSVERKTIHNES